MNRRIFFVAGMHRSGTSYLTQTLSLLGLKLPVSKCTGAPENPKGHFEPFDITQYFDNLLAGMDLSWDTFFLPPESWFLSEYADQAEAELSIILNREYPETGPIVLKDPRLCLFIPLWKKIVKKLGWQDFYIMPLRHPFDVAASLNERNKISKNRAILIWLNYLFSAEKCSRESNRSCIAFPQWTKNIEQTIGKVQKDLGTSLPYNNKRNILVAEMEYEESFVHHEAWKARSVSNDIEKLALDTFNSFVPLITDPFNTAALLEIDSHRDAFNKLSTLFVDIQLEYNLNRKFELEQATTQLLESENRAGELGQQLQMSCGEVEQITARLSENENRAGVLEQQLQASCGEVEQVTARLLESESRAGVLEQQLQASCGEVEQVTTRLLESENRAGVLEQQLQANCGEVEQVTARLLESENRVGELGQQLQASCGEVEQVTARLLESESRAGVLGQQLQASCGEVEQVTARLLESESRAGVLEQQLQASCGEVEQVTARLLESESRAGVLEQQLQASCSEVEQVTARLLESENRVGELGQQLEKETLSKQELHGKNYALKVQINSLNKQYEELILNYNKQKFTVIRPVYRNIYKATGLMLRNAFPSAWIESIKSIVPNPDSIPKRLSYKVDTSNKVDLLPELIQKKHSVSSPSDVFIFSIINWNFRCQRPPSIDISVVPIVINS